MKRSSSIILSTAIALSLSVGAYAKRPKPFVPSDNQFQRVLGYYSAVFDRFDADKDDALDESEIAAWQAAVAGGTFPLPPEPTFPLPEDFPTYDLDGNGKLSPKERAAVLADVESGDLELPALDSILPEALATYDTDGDGILNKAERTAARKAMQGAKLLPPWGFGSRLPKELKAYDADGDGKLSEDELAAIDDALASGELILPDFAGALPEDLNPYDADKDGKISASEWSAIIADIVSGKLTPPLRPLPDVLKPYDVDGDGKLNEEERAAVEAAVAAGTLVLPDNHHTHGNRPLPDVLKPYDTDNDGKLNETERAAVKAAIDAGTLVLPKPPTPPAHGPRPTDEQPPASSTDTGSTQPPEPPKPPQPPEDTKPQPPALPEELKAFDKDGDGKLSDAEREAAKAAIEAGTIKPQTPPQPPAGAQPPAPPLPAELKPYDVDGNGVLSDAEKAAVKAAIEDGTLKLPTPAQPQPPTGTQQPPAPTLPDALKAYDKDGDGKLSETELAAVKAAIADGTLKLPPPPAKPPTGGAGAPPPPPRR
ncbi:hypothetical protein ACXR0O_09660 [Verrucomicrobiota bacterium sgz303538]